MGKRRVPSGRDVTRILEGQEFAVVRRRGSHVTVQRRDGDTTTTVPVPDHDELRAGTLASIIRQAGVDRSLFDHP